MNRDISMIDPADVITGAGDDFLMNGGIIPRQVVIFLILMDVNKDES